MKQLFLSVVLTVAAGFTTQAQVTFMPGVRAGANFSTITNLDADSKTDFYIGAIGALKLSRFYTLQPEINYSRQGVRNATVTDYNYNNNGALITRKEDISLDYIGINLINKFGTKNFHFQVGPGLDIIASDNRYYNTSVDLTFNFGVGFDITENFGIEGRFKKGIIDVVESNYFYDNYNNSSNNTNTVLSVGAYFKFN